MKGFADLENLFVSSLDERPFFSTLLVEQVSSNLPSSLRAEVPMAANLTPMLIGMMTRRSTPQVQRNGPNAFGAVCMRIWVPHERCEACTA